MSGRAEVKLVPKPWGHEVIWAHTDRHEGQLVYWVKVDGEMRDMKLEVGDAFRITPGTVHYMEAVTDCDVLEASTPDLDDVVRLSDRYGREGTNAP